MRLQLQGVAVGPALTPSLLPVDGLLTDGAPAIVTVGGERAPLLASLIAGGRLAPDRGTVLLDGRDDPEALRRAVALVDTPTVAEPAGDLPVGVVVREELVFAGSRGSRAQAARLLRDLDLQRWERRPVADLPAADRLHLLLLLAARRPGVRALVLTSPERHGGTSADWLSAVRELTSCGTPVLVIAGHALDDFATSAQPCDTPPRGTPPPENRPPENRPSGASRPGTTP